MFFCCFLWLHLWFSRIFFGEIFHCTSHFGGIRILSTKKVGFVNAFFFIQIYVFYCCQKTGLIDFPGKRAPTKIKFQIFTAHRSQRDTNFNTKKVGFTKAVFSIFSNLCLLLPPKNWSYRFPRKTSSDYSKIFINSLPNFTEFHRRKLETIHCQFCFLCSCWRNKI